MTLFVENPKDSNKIVLDLIKKFNKVAEIQNKHTDQLHFYIFTMSCLTMKTVPLTVASKTI